MTIEKLNIQKTQKLTGIKDLIDIKKEAFGSRETLRQIEINGESCRKLCGHSLENNRILNKRNRENRLTFYSKPSGKYYKEEHTKENKLLKEFINSIEFNPLISLKEEEIGDKKAPQLTIPHGRNTQRYQTTIKNNAKEKKGGKKKFFPTASGEIGFANFGCQKLHYKYRQQNKTRETNMRNERTKDKFTDIDNPNTNRKEDKVTKSNVNKNMTFTITAWNIRSLNSFHKLKRILQMEKGIILLQEIWTPSRKITDIIQDQIVYDKRRPDKHGGTMLMINDERLKNLRNPHQINGDSEITKISVGGDRNIWITSLYIPKRNRKLLLDTLAEVQKTVPQSEWPYLILGGDWNINISDDMDKVTQTLATTCKKMGLTIIDCNCRHGEATIDFFCIGSQIQIKEKGNGKGHDSDHDYMWIKVEITAPPIFNKFSIAPNKKLAKEITQASLERCKNGQEFIHMSNKKYKYNKTKLKTKSRHKPKTNELLDRILTSEEDDDTLKIIKEYWKEKNTEYENQLLSNQLRKAFQYMKKLTKFHEYNRRDGSIINKVIKEDKSVTSNTDEVNRLVLDNLKNIQTKDDQPFYTQEIPFPEYQLISHSELDYILSKLFQGKAITYDGISDCLFSPENKKIIHNKLRDIWNANFEPQIFETRLIPLNKVHPNTPTPKDCRPIAVSSPMIRLLESRPRKTLEMYMIEKLHRGQTGFVPGQGISVNQMRLVQRVGEITSKKKHCYGLFVDFSTAYNTLLHTTLFERLEKVLKEEDIQLIRAIYSRTRIKLGNHSFSPNIGVAQGSGISPFLFNIYAEDLYYTLEKEVDINYKDLMGYADDLLVICTSLSQLRKAIQSIQRWSSINNLLLNSKKSGIIEFIPRSKSYPSSLSTGTIFEGIPVVDEYKYLGLIVDKKITCQPQLKHIEKKTTYQCTALWPILKAISLSKRITLWTMLIRPLFEMVIFPFSAERTKSGLELVRQKLRWSFKKFCLLKRNIDNKTIEGLMDFNFNERTTQVVRITKIKWELRIKGKIPSKEDFPKYPNKINIKKQVWYPMELAELINIKTALCKECKVPCHSNHLLQHHNIQVPENEELLQTMKEKSEELNKDLGKQKRKILQELGNIMKREIDKITPLLQDKP